MLYFITSNKGKFEEVQAALPWVEQLDIELPEIQGLDGEALVRAKLAAAAEHHAGQFIVEDTSLYIDALNGLPGPLGKWFLKAVGADGLYRMAEAFGGGRAVARSVFGYRSETGDTYCFVGEVAGRIVPPRGASGFGWDVIFQPDGHERTFAEMDFSERRSVKMRGIALEKLKNFLDQKQH